MKRVGVLALTLFLGANCTNHSSSELNNAVMNQNAQQASPTPKAAALDKITDDSKQPEEKKDVPPAFSKVDFKNLAYPISWKHRTIPLKDGHVEYFRDKYLGNAWFDFDDVDYVDLTGDKNMEAVVRLHWVSCGASCDGGSHLFYFYSIKRGRLRLLSRLETGSLAYGCGLKSLKINKRSIELEVFWKCHQKGSILDTDSRAEEAGKFVAKFAASSFTRFLFELNGKKLVMNKREVFPFPPGDAQNYSPTISVNND